MNYLRDCRLQKHVSQKDIAVYLGVTRQTYSNYESGKRQPDYETILKLAEYFDTTVDSLLRGPSDDGWNILDISKSAARVGQLYELADDHIRRIVDVALEPYESRFSDPEKKEEPTPRRKAERATAKARDEPVKVIPFPKPGPQTSKTDMLELIVYEDQLPAAGGISSYFDAPRYRTEQYPPGIVPAGTTFGVPVGGDSMEPLHAHHATAFVQGTPTVENGQIGLFSLNGEPYIKQFVVDAVSREIRLHSVNPKYKDILIGEHDDLRVLGRVLGSYPPYKKPVVDREDERWGDGAD